MKCDSVEKRRRYRLFNITAYRFFQIFLLYFAAPGILSHFELLCCHPTVIGRITGPAGPFARLSLRLSRTGSERETKSRRNIKIDTTVPSRLTGVTVFRSKVKGLELGLRRSTGRGRSHNMSALGWHYFLVIFLLPSINQSINRLEGAYKQRLTD